MHVENSFIHYHTVAFDKVFDGGFVEEEFIQFFQRSPLYLRHTDVGRYHTEEIRTGQDVHVFGALHID